MTGQIKLKFSGRELTEKEVTLSTSSSVESVIVYFSFDDEWNEYKTKSAVFISAESSCTVLLGNDNFCIVPWEVLKNSGYIDIGVIGQSGTKILPSVKASVYVAEGVYDSGNTPKEPSPDAYQQIILLMQETQQTAKIQAENASKAANEAKESAENAKSAEQTAKNSADNARTSQAIAQAAEKSAQSSLENARTAQAIAQAAEKTANDAANAAKSAEAGAENALKNIRSGNVDADALNVKAYGQQIISANNAGNTAYGEVILRASDINFLKNNAVGNAWLRMSDSGNLEVQCVKGRFTIGTQNGELALYNRSGGFSTVSGVADPYNDNDAANKRYVDNIVGDIETALDNVIAIQSAFIGD